MVKTNHIIFIGCVIFLIIFFSFIYYQFAKTLHNFKTVRSLNKNLSDERIDSSMSVEGKDTSSIQLSSQSEDVQSYPPCHSFGHMRWFHDMNTGECYEVGTIGPCGESMTFYQHPDKHLKNFGFCDCDDVVEVKSGIMECEGVERPLVYYPLKDRCYTVFSQGPCHQGEWLVLNDSSYQPLCAKNPCLHSLGGDKVAMMEDEFGLQFWFAHHKKCYRTLSRGYCNKGEILKVTKNNWKPSCQKNILGNCPPSASVSIPALRCLPGNRIHQLGMCNLP